MKTSLSSLHKCDQCELNFLSKEGKEKHCARVHQVHHGQDVQQQHQVNKVQTPRFKIQAHQVEASPKLDCKQCGERFKTKADLQKHKATAKSVGTCLPCLKEKSKPRFTNMCEFTKHKKEHEKRKTLNETAKEQVREDAEIRQKPKRKNRSRPNYAEDSPTKLEDEKKAPIVRKDAKDNDMMDNKKRKLETEVFPKPKMIKLGSQPEKVSKIVTIEKIADGTSAISETGSKILVTGLKGSDTLQEAVKDVKKIEEYACNSCPKFFPTNQSLKLHENIHLAEKPFKCPECGKTFAQKGNMRVHMYKNHGITEEGKDLDKKEEQEPATTNSVPSPGEIEEKLVQKDEEVSSLLAQDPAPPQAEVALIEKTEFHYPTFTWAQLVQQGIVGEDANFLPPAKLEVESELVIEDMMLVMEDKMMVMEDKMLVMEDKKMMEERIFVQVAPDSADGQQIIGF